MTTSADTGIDGLDMSLAHARPAWRRLRRGGAGSSPSSCSSRFCRRSSTGSASRCCSPTPISRIRWERASTRRCSAFLMTSFVFAYGCSGLLLSFVGDLYGLRRSLAIGTAFWGVFMALMAGAGSFTTMLSLRILLGIAEGPQFAITNSLVKRWFPHARAGTRQLDLDDRQPARIGDRLSPDDLPRDHVRLAFGLHVPRRSQLVIILPLVLMFLGIIRRAIGAARTDNAG